MEATATDKEEPTATTESAPEEALAPDTTYVLYSSVRLVELY